MFDFSCFFVSSSSKKKKMIIELDSIAFAGGDVDSKPCIDHQHAVQIAREWCSQVRELRWKRDGTLGKGERL